MTLTTDYTARRFVVTHTNGSTEAFKSLEAVYVVYPQLRPEPQRRKQTKLERRQERIEAGQRV